MPWKTKAHEGTKEEQRKKYDAFCRDGFYSTRQWQLFRTMILRRDEYICQRCRAAMANTVDHILPRLTNPHLAYSESNVTSLCHSCHSIKSGEERKMSQQVRIHNNGPAS